MIADSSMNDAQPVADRDAEAALDALSRALAGL